MDKWVQFTWWSCVQVVGIYQVTPVFTSFTAKVIHTEAATRGLLYKKVFLQIPQKSRENTCARVSFLIKLQVLKVFSKLKVFSCEFCEIPNNTFFTEQRWTTASITSSQLCMPTALKWSSVSLTWVCHSLILFWLLWALHSTYQIRLPWSITVITIACINSYWLYKYWEKRVAVQLNCIFDKTSNLLKILIRKFNLQGKCIFANCCFPEAATGCVLSNKVFLKILQISQRYTCVGISF